MQSQVSTLPIKLRLICQTHQTRYTSMLSSVLKKLVKISASQLCAYAFHFFYKINNNRVQCKIQACHSRIVEHSSRPKKSYSGIAATLKKKEEEEGWTMPEKSMEGARRWSKLRVEGGKHKTKVWSFRRLIGIIRTKKQEIPPTNRTEK